MIVIDDMRSRGKAGYIAKILDDGTKQFLHPVERSGYGGSRQTLSFDLTKDGIYEVCDANFGSSKRNIYFIKIEDGKQCDRFDSLAELLTSDIKLPELQGSEGQISWAETIRMRLITKFKQAGRNIPDRVYTEASAKFWIDNRAKAEGK